MFPLAEARPLVADDGFRSVNGKTIFWGLGGDAFLSSRPCAGTHSSLASAGTKGLTPTAETRTHGVRWRSASGARPRRDLDMPPQSRDTLRPSSANSSAPRTRPIQEGAVRPSRGRRRSQEGRREDRVRAAPAVSRAKAVTKGAHEHTGSAEAVRPSLRNGFTAYFVLSPVTGFLATVAARKYLRQLDASIGASGPHDFAVRVTRCSSKAPPRPPHPRQRS